MLQEVMTFQRQPVFEDLDFDELKREFKALEEQFPALTQAYTMAENPDPPDTRILVRGDFRNPGVRVDPVCAFRPAAIASRQARPPRAGPVAGLRRQPPHGAGHGESALAALLRHGLGFDFGRLRNTWRAPQPSRLLDWLAVEFMEKGWDTKALIRLIVTSATYRQSSDVRPDLSEVDPSKPLLGRQSRIRLPAEIIRDSAFAAAGLLDRRIGGTSVRPYLPDGALRSDSGTS